MTLEKFEASEGHTGEREKKADARKGERESGWNYFRSTATGFMHLHSLFFQGLSSRSNLAKLAFFMFPSLLPR